MKDKEKQVEEMANDISYLTLNREVYVGFTEMKNVSWTLSEEDNKIIAEVLVENGWIKPNEDSVVLSKEELNEIINQTKETEKNYYKKVVIPQERKETAEKFADLLFSHITTREVWEELRALWLHIGSGKKANLPIWNLLIEPVAKQFGVEIKE